MGASCDAVSNIMLRLRRGRDVGFALRFFADCSRCGATPIRGPEFFWCEECEQVPPAVSAKSVTYFEAVGLPSQFDVDMSVAKANVTKFQKRFEELARVGSDVVALKAYVKRCGDAVRVLRDPLRRSKYLIELHSVDRSKANSDTLPAVASLENEALSAEVEDVGTVARVIERNSNALRDVEVRLFRAVRNEQWADAREYLRELGQRRTLSAKLADLLVENNELATPAHSSTIGGIE